MIKTRVFCIIIVSELDELACTKLPATLQLLVVMYQCIDDNLEA